MFDAGFFELVLIGVIALLVIGPERLPSIAQKAGKWLGRGRRMVNSVRDDIDKELKAEQLKSILDNQKDSNPLHEIIEDTQRTIGDIKKDTETAMTDAEKSFNETTSDKTEK